MMPPEPLPYPSDGHVAPGGPAAARTVTVSGVAVEVRKLSVGEMDNNVYLLTDVDRGAAVLGDAAADAERILAEIGDRTVETIVTTHGHWDHIRALDEVAEATGALLAHHPIESEAIGHQPDVLAVHGTRLHVGAAPLEVRHTPGHTPGSVSLLLGPHHLFSGDTLFPGGPGATFGDAEAFATIMRSLREQLFTLDDATWVYPGHGDDTTIGDERPDLDAWEQRGW